MDVIRTQGDIAGLKAQKDPAALAQAREQLEKSGKPTNDAAVMQQAYDNAMRQYGTGSDLQKAALTALAGNNLAGALASGASPYLATEIKKRVGEDNMAANAMAHAVLNKPTSAIWPGLVLCIENINFSPLQPDHTGGGGNLQLFRIGDPGHGKPVVADNHFTVIPYLIGLLNPGRSWLA
ncbi:hypothetical protein PTR03_02445 [Serratia nevei]|uniref:hypothetical protein n=1 Tax=Serratia nevei TaxID=2703794 RepID=UPI0029E150C8|nr:hypothetical protein [Serratia marcescens]